ncbi:ATP-dependent (S)-NAD(P)H-hydrate dehydratase [Neocloeon triangulifer]|uniref:ATP-dependent (S)-NAD(P)H-hydrate dehydratase n=1 Tax=Neocloeon triangulifer TaxID=2078957 RepID=UPI00286F0319|nr:ATP-dependent (S)-NAD(P)H-hydrate dehydratase [Neocloeon triangulifer]
MSSSLQVLEEAALFEQVRAHIVPDFSVKGHKGLAGRVGVVGGSEEYTGAPFFAAMSALRTGCDLAHVFCLPQAAPVIKGYSPDLIVHPLLGHAEKEKVAETVGPWLPRLHTVIIGPGLGRDPQVLEGVSHVIDLCREAAKPLVVDADGLWLATLRPDLFKDYPGPLVLTPNVVEYERLAKAIGQGEGAMAAAFGPNTVVLRKGPSDLIEGALGEKVECTAQGSWRRCGGQGDLLSGSIGTFLSWEVYQKVEGPQTGIRAAYAACRLVRDMNRRAFAKSGRSTCASDMLAEVHGAFEELYGQ